jgi:hypothetical protein
MNIASRWSAMDIACTSSRLYWTDRYPWLRPRARFGRSISCWMKFNVLHSRPHDDEVSSVPSISWLKAVRKNSSFKSQLFVTRR